MRPDADRTDVVLVCLPGKDDGGRSFGYHLGAGYIASYLKAQGLRVVQFQENGPWSFPGLVQWIVEQKPRIAGFTVYASNCGATMLVAQALKRLCRDISIVFGGPAATVLPEKILERCPDVDLCVRGEGEEVLFRICQCLSGGTGLAGLSRVSGISLREEDTIVHNPDSRVLVSTRPSEHYLDNYPSPYLSGHFPPSASWRAGIVTSRGCNQNCTYCNCNLLSGYKVFPHSVERVLAELDCIQRAGYPDHRVMIWDDAFNLFPKRTEKICRGLIENKIRVPLVCSLRIDLLTEDLLALMKEAGVIYVSLPLESASPRVLRTIGKVCPPDTEGDPDFSREKAYIEKTIQFAALARKMGFQLVTANVMVGLPGETPEEARETIRFVKALEVDGYAHNIFRIYPGTKIFADHARFGYALSYGESDGLFPETVHPYPVQRDIRPAENAQVLQGASRKELETARLLSLTTQQQEPGTCFRNVVLVDTPESELLTQWCRRNLAIGGTVLLLSSAPGRDARGRTGHDPASESAGHSDWDTMGTCFSWTFEGIMEPAQVSPTRIRLFRDRPRESSGVIRVQAKRFLGRKEAGEGKARGAWVCSERDPSDSSALQGFLRKTKEAWDPFLVCYAQDPFPYHELLCKWLTRDANCRVFETALIDSTGQVRLCWHGPPAGTLSDDQSRIVERFRFTAREALLARPCADCPVAGTCIRCAFPFPLTSDQYCRYRRELGNRPVTECLRTLYGGDGRF